MPPSLPTVTTDDTRLSRMKRAVPDGTSGPGLGRKWDPLRARPSAAPQALCVRARTVGGDSSGRQSATAGHVGDMRSQEEEGLEEALACLSLSLRDYEDEESRLPPPPPPLRCSPFLSQQSSSPSPLPSPLCRRPSPLSRPPSCLSLPRLSFSARILEERIEEKQATSSSQFTVKGRGGKQLFPSYSSPSLGLHRESKASGRKIFTDRVMRTCLFIRSEDEKPVPCFVMPLLLSHHSVSELAKPRKHAQACRQLVPCQRSLN